MLWSLRNVPTDGATLAPSPRSLRRRRLTAPAYKQYAMDFVVGGHECTVRIRWCTRRAWDRRWNCDGPWSVAPIGPFFVIAVKVSSR